jgi:multidrug efflux pump subunit AcrA (membrane-fusion protein)
LADTLSKGLITIPDPQGANETDYPMVEVVLGDIIRYSELNVRLEGAFQQDLRFERDDGRLGAIHVNQWDMVKKDDVLAELYFDNEALETERRQLLLRMEQFEAQYANDDMSWLNRLDKASEFTIDMGENNWEVHQLNFMKQELEYEKFIFTKNEQRKGYIKQLEDIDERLAGEQILAPFDGVISYVFSARVENPVHSWQRVLTIVDDSSVYFTLTASKDIIRYGDVFSLTDRSGEITFDVAVVNDPVSPLQPESAYLYWLTPTDPDAFAALAESLDMGLLSLGAMGFFASPLTMEIRNVPIVPRRAIHPEDKKSFVWLYENDTLKKRYVKTGLAFADDIQIIQGLEVGQLVVLIS